MRKRFVVGNWKMNLSLQEGMKLGMDVLGLLKKIKLEPTNKIIICPPFTHLKTVFDLIQSNKNANIILGSQNCSSQENGAFTGEVSPEILKSFGVEYVIIGHSERRKYFFETNEIIEKKISIALKFGLKPIFCCGEEMEVRKQNKHFETINQQITTSLFNFSNQDISKIIIAYEPVWAIGTGINATAQEAEEMHLFIRNKISDKYGIEIADNISILYGGSCKAENAKEIFIKKNVDGGLIGGASLKSDEFVKIVQSL